MLPKQDFLPAPSPTQTLPVAAGDRTTKLALVIPTICEAKNIEHFIQRVQRVLSTLRLEYELIVVDDDSGDGIETVVIEMARLDRRIRMMTRRGERGLSGSILHGWLHRCGSAWRDRR